MSTPSKGPYTVEQAVNDILQDVNEEIDGRLWETLEDMPEVVSSLKRRGKEHFERALAAGAERATQLDGERDKWMKEAFIDALKKVYLFNATGRAIATRIAIDHNINLEVG